MELQLSKEETTLLKNVQTSMLKMMILLDRFCQENGIVYSLCGGTLLGAIRHNGFIPWDDDMDIMLARQDFETLLRVFPENGYAGVILERTEWVYRFRKTEDSLPFSATIDVFIVDRVPENAALHALQVLGLKMLQGMMKTDVEYERYSEFYRLCLYITGAVGKLIPDEMKFRRYDALSRLGNSGNSKFVSCFNDQFSLLKVEYDADLMRRVERHPFESAEFFVTSRYEHYLHTQYGNYMLLPPESERKPAHLLRMERLSRRKSAKDETQ